ELVLEAADAVIQHSSPEALAAQLRRIVHRPDAQPVVGYLWIRWLDLDLFHWWTMRAPLAALRTRGQIGEEATRAYLLRLMTGWGLALTLYVAGHHAA